LDKILLIDAMNAMWRASISFAPKKTDPPPPSDWIDNGQPNLSTNDEWTMRGDPSPPKVDKDIEEEQKYVLIFNFFRNLRPLIELFSPDKCFFVLEGHPKFRYDLFPEYKANRLIKQASKQEMMDKFLVSKDKIVRLIQHLPITTARAMQYECDDVIATLCEDMREEELTIISNDSDYIQLLQRGYKSCRIYNPIKKVFMEAPTYPYVAWKCLNGDKSDNIPALLKPAKALKTVSDSGLFQSFMNTEENRANFNINRQLIEFRSVPMEEITLQEGVKDFLLLKQAFEKMKFESIINDRSWLKYTQTFNCIKF
jgi:5'-3' exonuclease